jgi:hypothetical protein
VEGCEAVLFAVLVDVILDFEEAVPEAFDEDKMKM